MSRPTFLILSLISFPYTGTGQVQAPLLFNPENLPQEAAANCALDVGQATFSLGQAGTSLFAAVRFCKQVHTAAEQARCSAAINFVVMSFAFVASFLSQAATNCATSVSLEAMCAADITNLLGDFAAIAAAGSSLTQTCGNWLRSKDEDLVQLLGHDRRLEMVNSSEIDRLQRSQLGRAALAQSPEKSLQELAVMVSRLQKELQEHRREMFHAQARKLGMQPEAAARMLQVGAEFSAALALPDEVDDSDLLDVLHALQKQDDRGANIASCFFNVGQAAWYLMRAALTITQAVKVCPEMVVEAEGAVGRMQCAADLTGVIGSFAYAASALSYSVSQCPDLVNIDAQCGGDVANIIAAVTGIGTSGSSFLLTCAKNGHVSGLHPERRLEEMVRVVV